MWNLLPVCAKTILRFGSIAFNLSLDGSMTKELKFKLTRIGNENRLRIALVNRARKN